MPPFSTAELFRPPSPLLQISAVRDQAAWKSAIDKEGLKMDVN